MTTWFTSDTHFGHANIIKYCNRPFGGIYHMDETLVNNWNAVVGDTDVVYHLGDVALGAFDRWDEILTSLNGYKVLLVGNHDRIFKGEKERTQERFYNDYAKWFDEIWDHYTTNLSNGQQVNLSHFPYNGDSHDGDRYEEYRTPDRGVPLIHGHTHSDKILSRSSKGTLQVHVGVDAWNYSPVSEEQVINALNLDVPEV